MFSGADTYGNRAKHLPDRLSDAVDPDFAGVIAPATLPPGIEPVNHLRHPRKEPAGFEPFREPDLDGNGGKIIPNSGFPGFDTLFRQKGADGFINTDDEQARYTFENVLDFRFGLLKTRDQDAGGTTVVGPWLPKNRVVANGLLRDRANPYRGRFAPGGGERFHQADRKLTTGADGPDELNHPLSGLKTRFNEDYEDTYSDATRADLLHPDLLELLARPETDLIKAPADGPLDFDFWPPGSDFPGTQEETSGFRASEYFALRTNGSTFSDGKQKISNLIPSLDTLFGGDFNPTFPCINPEPFVAFAPPNQNVVINQIRGNEFAKNCFPDGEENEDFIITNTFRSSGLSTKVFPAGFGSNRRISGGGGELPFRPATDIGVFGSITPGDDGVLGTADDVTVVDENKSLQLAQGLYYPSVGLRSELLTGRFDNSDVNFTEYERAFNRGQSQQDQGELKEAYLDLEFLDSRLWARIGLQNIVWGKTELFRTTDQFNPQDFALSSLPSLEESRIALWSGRFVYSLYDLWDFEDVRIEFAFNLDQYQPADLGGCGEPYTINVACGIPFGLSAHSLLGIGLVGVDRPENAWDNFKGLEFGGRIEWRWSRFSFAVTDFLGYSDFPYIDLIFEYDRNVDPESGRPRIAMSDGPCPNSSAFQNTPGAPLRFQADSVVSVGTASDCLKPGGAPGEANSNGLGIDPGSGRLRFGVDPTASPQNALYYHHANQQIFATICSATVSIAAALDPTACAFNVFSTRQPLAGGITNPDIPLVQVFAAFLAGEPSSGQGNLNRAIASNATGGIVDVVPTVNLNREFGFGFGIFNRGLNPGLSHLTSYNLVGGDFLGALSLDSTLTGEQRALLGCGPFWGTRCDSSADDVVAFGGQRIVRYSFMEGGGADALNAEASVLLQAWPGVEGTGVVGLNGFEEGMDWSTTGRVLRQPGTVGFDGAPVATRYAPGIGDALTSTTVDDFHVVADANGIVRLPGSRGVATPYDLETYGFARDASPADIDSSAKTITFTMQEGYNPMIDGCILAPTMTDGRNGDVYAVRGEMLHKASGTWCRSLEPSRALAVIRPRASAHPRASAIRC